jgi:hypothetical protein
MHQRTIASLIVGLTLQPSLAVAAGCDLGQATFRPKYATEDFVLRSHRAGDDLLFDITVRQSGEAFRFKVDVDETTGEGLIASMPDDGERDPRVKTTFALADTNGLKVTTQREVHYIAFLDLGRASSSSAPAKGSSRIRIRPRHRGFGN